MDNTLAPLFGAERRAGTLAVLSGAAPAGANPDTRDRLAKWPGLRNEVLQNARQIAEGLDPCGVGDADRLAGSALWWLVPAVRAYGRARLALDRWLSDVVAAIEGFDRGLAEAGRGAVTVNRLRELHLRVVEAYSGREYFNLRGGA